MGVPQENRRAPRKEKNMATIRVTKEFGFEAAHALYNYDGECSNIHGHSYRLFVTVKGEPSLAPGHPKNGMVVDFAVLKKIVECHFPPTCEMLLADFAGRIREELPASISLESLRLYETATSYAEWYACDNPLK